MAKTTDEPLLRGKRPTYPWNEWMDGRIWILTRGEDFDGTVYAMRSQVYARGRSRQVKVTTNIRGEDELRIQFHPAPVVPRRKTTARPKPRPRKAR